MAALIALILSWSTNVNAEYLYHFENNQLISLNRYFYLLVVNGDVQKAVTQNDCRFLESAWGSYHHHGVKLTVDRLFPSEHFSNALEFEFRIAMDRCDRTDLIDLAQIFVELVCEASEHVGMTSYKRCY